MFPSYSKVCKKLIKNNIHSDKFGFKYHHHERCLQHYRKYFVRKQHIRFFKVSESFINFLNLIYYLRHKEELQRFFFLVFLGQRLKSLLHHIRKFLPLHPHLSLLVFQESSLFKFPVADHSLSSHKSFAHVIPSSQIMFSTLSLLPIVLILKISVQLLCSQGNLS